MPPTTTDTTKEASEAPALSLSPASAPPLANPAIDDSGLKAMAAKFKAEMSGARPATTETAPDPSKMAAPPKAAEPPKEAPAEPTTETAQPNPTPLPGREPAPKRADFKALEQARDEFKTKAEKLQLERDETAKRLKALEDEYGSLKKVLPTEPTEIQKALEEREKLAKEREQLIATVETVNLERSPRFQNWFTSERDKHLRVALKHVPAAQQEAVKDILLNNPADPKLDEILEPLSKTAQRLVTGAIEGLEKLKMEREEALSKGSEKWKELQAHERAEAEKAANARKAQMQKLADAAIARARNLPAFQQRDGDEAHNSAIKEREAIVKATVLGQLDEDTMVAVPGMALEGLRLRDHVVPALEKKIAEQEKLIKSLQQASPSMGDGVGAAERGAPESGPGDGQSFAKRVRSLMTSK